MIILMECDACRRKFGAAGGGICSRCRRLLCSRHLHGWLQGWRVFRAGELLCVGCRREKRVSGRDERTGPPDPNPLK